MKTYSDFRNRVGNNSTSCVAETQTIIENIEKNKHLNLYIQTNSKALELAQKADTRFAEGNPRSLEGMLVAAKDNFSVKGMNATCASKILSNYEPIYNATVIQRIIDNGGILIGKTNMDEFAMGSSNETSYFGGCKNPHNNDYVTGGSSGGSAAVIPAELAMAALGSDTGGSIRQPAAFCGSIGFKPTYGTLSRFGLIAFSSSLDTIGTLTGSIEDTALLYDAMSGIDNCDATSVNMPHTNTFASLNNPLPNALKVGLLPDSVLKHCSEDVLKVYSKYLEKLKSLGAKFQTLNFDFIDICVPTYLIITTSEASSNLARLDSIKFGYRAANCTSENYIDTSRGEGFGIEVKRRLLLGTYFLSNSDENNYLAKAKKLRSKITYTTKNFFSKVDCIFLPTTATTAFKHNERVSDPVAMYLSDFFTTSANLSGIPAISIPAGTNENCLPIGMQLQANYFNEDLIFRIAKSIL